ncbi:MAG: 2-amino-4-hydroxy-6-hydroxymethyldihydropteridine diphosphokinase [Sphingomonadales bacterium]|nr:MAG: 2-amino-4-hydroxy-6-hydroxymethyldihydropteridine diphosphokinase [Sphingomonadales bacterium]
MLGSETHQYLIALGSNQRHRSDGSPPRVLEAAIEVLEDVGLLFLAISPSIASAPIGPSSRRFANACAVVETRRTPPEMLALAKGIEQAFGRRPGGQRWRARVLDIDIILWSGGIWAHPQLSIPHPEFRDRDFVLGPARVIAPGWRDPISGLSLAQLFARLTKPRPAPR